MTQSNDETTDAIQFMVSKDIDYYKQQIKGSSWALIEPDHENTDEYLDRCDAIRNYHEKRSELKHKYGIDFEGEI